MDGNTWRRYRLVTERGPEPPFFMEPDNPDQWPAWFAAAGFSPLANYFSAMNDDLSLEDPRIPRAEERLRQQGVRLRPIQPEWFVGELRRIYAVTRVSFQANFLYTPITEAEFLAQYEQVQASVKSELVLLAERDDQPVGFVFGIPDLAQSRRGAIDTVRAQNSSPFSPGAHTPDRGNPGGPLPASRPRPRVPARDPCAHA